MYQDAPRAGFARRLSAIIYDLLILCAIIMLAAGLAMLFVQILVWGSLVSLQGHEDIAAYLTSSWRRWLYFAYLLAVILGFYIYFWCKAGQTLGMRAWRLLLVTSAGQPLTFWPALHRALLSFGGLGNFWLWLRWGKGLALQDQLTQTQMIVLTKEQSKALNLHKTAR